MLRLASSDFTKLAPPCIDFPPDLARILYGHIGFINGGLNLDGSELGALHEEEVLEQCQLLKSKKITKVVIVGTFSPLDDKFSQEENAKAIICRELPDADVICSAKGILRDCSILDNTLIVNSWTTWLTREGECCDSQCIFIRLGKRVSALDGHSPPVCWAEA